MLTAVQHKTYQFIKQYIQKHGYAPSTTEIAKGIKIKSRGVVYRYLLILVDKGLIKLIPNRRRNIQLIDIDNSHNNLSVIGQIAAGSPIDAIAETETIDMVNLFAGANLFALRVKGNSMVDDGIIDRDIVICKQQKIAQNGQTVVALIDNQAATLKRFFQNSDNSITLLPANADHNPQHYSADRVQIQGIFIGLLRY